MISIRNQQENHKFGLFAQAELSIVNNVLSEPAVSHPTVAEIERLDEDYTDHFCEKLSIHSALSRSIVSFQANKERAVYRWYKYKEAFSASLVETLLVRYKITRGKLLDPFAGTGTALFAASELGIESDGIELLPIGQQIIAMRQLVQAGLEAEEIVALYRWAQQKPWQAIEMGDRLLELRITRGAYPASTQQQIEQYLCAIQQETPRLRTILFFALLCIVESISFTRKDGQYLRWDHRSGRTVGKKVFNKGPILSFEEAIQRKLSEIIEDLRGGFQTTLFPISQAQASVSLYGGSCLERLPTLPNDAYQVIITSPPYCNRYDYTRTYALELALLGVDEKKLVELRQQMVSCTVENRSKDLLQINPAWSLPIKIADEQPLLQSILRYLDAQKASGNLNNDGIPRMVRGYFYEMACVIAECARVLQTGAPMIMVNDNVRYAGVSISVDLILSDMAGQLGFEVEQILVLPTEKGNSSQQMGEHGRKSLRKCIYIWRKK